MINPTSSGFLGDNSKIVDDNDLLKLSPVAPDTSGFMISSSMFQISSSGVAFFQGFVTGSAVIGGDDVLIGDSDGTRSKIKDVRLGAMRATASLDSSARFIGEIKEDTATVGGTAIATIKTGGTRAAAVLDSNNKFTGDIGSGATIDSVAVSDIKTGASRANAAIDASNNVLNVNGTTASTIVTRATTSISEYIIFSDSSVADSSTGDTITGVRQYAQTGNTSSASNLVKTKIVFSYVHNANNKTLQVRALCKQSANTRGTSGNFPCKLIVGVDDITSSPTSYGAVSAGGSSNTFDDEAETVLATNHGTTFTNKFVKIDVSSSGANLTAGTIYQVSVAMRGGVNAAGTGAVTMTMTGVIVTAVGSS